MVEYLLYSDSHRGKDALSDCLQISDSLFGRTEVIEVGQLINCPKRIASATLQVFANGCQSNKCSVSFITAAHRWASIRRMAAAVFKFKPQICRLTLSHKKLAHLKGKRMPRKRFNEQVIVTLM